MMALRERLIPTLQDLKSVVVGAHGAEGGPIARTRGRELCSVTQTMLKLPDQYQVK